MPAFDVTTNPSSLDRPLKPGDKATIVVTATSRLPRPVTGRVSGVVVPVSFESYVQPKSTQRMFSQAGSTQEFPFTIAVPPGAESGSFTVRFDAVDVERQDDNFGQSSLFRVTVEGSAIIPPPPPPKRWWLWVAIAAGVIVVALVIWLLTRGKSGPNTAEETCTPTYGRDTAGVVMGEILLFSGAPDARGARVYLNDVCQDYMLTRESGAILLLAKVPPGGFHISVRKEGYQNLERDITVVAGQRVSVDFDLRR